MGRSRVDFKQRLVPVKPHTAQLVTLQLAVRHPIAAHGVHGAALYRLLVLDPCVAPPEVEENDERHHEGDEEENTSNERQPLLSLLPGELGQAEI